MMFSFLFLQNVSQLELRRGVAFTPEYPPESRLSHLFVVTARDLLEALPKDNNGAIKNTGGPKSYGRNSAMTRSMVR